MASDFGFQFSQQLAGVLIESGELYRGGQSGSLPQPCLVPAVVGHWISKAPQVTDAEKPGLYPHCRKRVGYEKHNKIGPFSIAGRLQSQEDRPQRRAMVWIGGKAQVLARRGMDMPRGNQPSKRRALRAVLTRLAYISPKPGRRSVCMSSSQLQSFT